MMRNDLQEQRGFFVVIVKKEKLCSAKATEKARMQH